MTPPPDSTVERRGLISRLDDRRTARVVFVLIFAVGAFLRWRNVDWDVHHHLHPDERHISMVEEGLHFPRSPAAYLDSAGSPLNPYNTSHNSFVYGMLPMFLTKAIAAALHKDFYDGAYLVGRVLSGLFDLATVWLTYLLARRFGSRGRALLAALLMAFCPLGIQLAHFWTVDSFLTTFVTAALLGIVRIATGRSGWKGDVATGLALGLAVACKVTALALFAPAGVALLLAAFGLRAGGASTKTSFLRQVPRGLVLLAVALVTIRIALPYSFRGVGLDPRYVADMKSLMNLGRSVAGFPPALQWAGRTVLFPVRNFVFWGAGPAFGLAAIAATIWAAFAAWTRRRRALLPLLALAAVLCTYHGFTLAKSIRYFYPVYPVFAVFTALFLLALAERLSASRLARALPLLVAAGTVLAGLAFSSIYARPMTRVEATHWIYAHVPPARFGNESWDDGLPLSQEGQTPDLYAGPSLDMWGPDNAEKLEILLKALDKADWIAITSNRVYGNITRLPMVYPMSTAYYRALFEERLGFERAAEFHSYPSLGPLEFPDDLAEEQFTVYDHPRVQLFKKTKAFSLERARSILAATIVKTPITIWEWEKLPRRAREVTSPLVPARSAARPPEAAPHKEWPAHSLPAAVLFYAAIAVVGAAAFPIAFLLFPRLLDRGFGFARVLGMVLATHGLTLAVRLHAAANGRTAALSAFAALIAAGAIAFAARRRAILAFLSENRRRLWASEAVFAFGFLFFIFFRVYAPEIWWGEKPMDFSILNILTRSLTLPASDPWFSGAPLRYYTLGQQGIAWISQLTGISTRFTFNLAFGYLGGATLQAAFALVFAWTSRLRAGFLGAAMVGLLGNLSGVYTWYTTFRPKHQRLDWNYFWATTRVIPDTINEYPLWSLIFADLHSHVFAFPVLLLLVASALQLVRSHADPASRLPERAAESALFGAVAAVLVLTNAWDAPLTAGLLVAVPILLALAGKGLAAAGRAVLAFAVSVAAAASVALPLWVKGNVVPGMGRNSEGVPRGILTANVFGLFYILLLGWILVALLRPGGAGGRIRTVLAAAAAAFLAAIVLAWPIGFCAVGIIAFLGAAIYLVEEPEDRLAFGLAGTAFFLVAFAELFFIYDRMNTYFKLFLEAWILFAVAAAVLVFGSRERRGSWARWPFALRLPAFGAFGLALFTLVTISSRYFLGRTRPPGEATSPTLDGMAYLPRMRPGDDKAILWLRETIRGTPVVLEAHGPSYQEFGRISMNTGLPTVLGWDYHVQQRGNADTATRAAAVESIYSTPSAELAEGLLRRYHVGYVYVGRLERTTYPAAGLAKFDAASDTFPLVYENPEVRIYRLAGGDTADVILPTREELPAPAPAEKAAEPESEKSEPEAPPAIAAKAAPGGLPFGGMREPRGAAVDAQGRVWVADFGNSRLKVFDAQGGLLGGWGGRGNAPHGFRELCAVSARGDDLYVADTWNGRVELFTLAGERKASAAELYGPRGVAAAPDGSVWVADTGNNRIIAYDRLLQNPHTYGKKGSEPGEFDGPVGIAVGRSGLVYVADTGNRRVQVFDAAGKFTRAVRILGWGPGSEPQIALDDAERLYVADPEHNCVFVFDRAGERLDRLTADDAGRAFARPSGLAIDRKGLILYVVNAGNNSVTTRRLPGR